MGRSCFKCGSTEIDEDPARGDASCMECGQVLESSMVVSENQFQERAGGTGVTIIGQFVSAERGGAHNLQGVPGLSSHESREVTFQKGRKAIEEIASQLRINAHCVDTAHNFFKMCVTRNLTRGRLRTHVVAACLYMTCRIENTSHLLLDFSDVTQVNVFELGRTLSFISRSLRINLPTTDPCLYIMRFACLLEFGDKQKEVVTLATRLVERMKKDWISSGRRPTGLCGAALLIAARSHNFNRTISDVVRVVHISEAVVRKRLEEFGQTPSAALTIDEFASVDLEACEDPPAYREAKRRVHEEQRRKEIEEAERVQYELQPLEEQLEKELEKKRKEKFKRTPYAKLICGDALDDPELGQAEGNLVSNEIINTIYNVAEGKPNKSTTFNRDALLHLAPSMQTMGLRGSPSTPSTSSSSYSQGLATIPTTSHIAMAQHTPVYPKHYHHREQKPHTGMDEFDDIDDDEIDSYILTEAESMVKERIWMRVNGEALEALEKRKREREEQEERDRNDPSKKKRRKSTAKRAQVASQTAAQAIEKVIQEKGLSKKVNYDILKEIETATLASDFYNMNAATASDSVNEDTQITNGNEMVVPKKFDESALSQESPIPVKPSLEHIKGKMSIASIQLTDQERHMRRVNASKGTPQAIEKLRTAFDITIDPLTDADKEAAEKTPKAAGSAPKRRRAVAKPNIGVGTKRSDALPGPPPPPSTSTSTPTATGSQVPADAAGQIDALSTPTATTPISSPLASPRPGLRSAAKTSQPDSQLPAVTQETSQGVAQSPRRVAVAYVVTPATKSSQSQLSPSVTSTPVTILPSQATIQPSAEPPTTPAAPKPAAAPPPKGRYLKAKPMIGKAKPK